MLILTSKTFPLDHLSATSLTAFAGCPENFRQRYLLHRPEARSGDLFMGNVNHETIAELLRRKMGGVGWVDYASAEQKIDWIRSVYRETWQHSLDSEGEPDWRDDDPSEMYSRGLLMAVTYIDRLFAQIDPIAVEERLTLQYHGLPLIVGHVDVIEADKIRERKTTRAKESKPKQKWLLQGRIYQAMSGVPIEWEVLTRQVEPKLYTSEDFPELRLPIVSVENTKRLIVDLWWRMNDLYQRFGSEHVWPTDGYFDPWLCNYCSIGPRYASTCGAWS